MHTVVADPLALWASLEVLRSTRPEDPRAPSKFSLDPTEPSRWVSNQGVPLNAHESKASEEKPGLSLQGNPTVLNGLSFESNKSERGLWPRHHHHQEAVKLAP